MFYLILFSSYLFTPTKAPDHALYLSIIEIKSEEMRVKVFSDNLKDAIRNDLGSVEGYFQKRIKLQINDQFVNFSLKEINEEGESKWITFDLVTPEKWDSFNLEANYFMELFPDQINVVQVLKGKPQYFRLTKQNPSCSINY